MMAILIVETGSIVDNANTYITLAEFKSFVSYIAIPLATDDEYNRAIILAARYLDGNYRHRWKGHKVFANESQSMEFPRAGIIFGSGFYSQEIPYNIIPKRIKDAQCELALRALSSELSTDVQTGIRRERVDVLETEYFSGATPKTSYPVVDQFINDYIHPVGCMPVIRG